MPAQRGSAAVWMRSGSATYHLHGALSSAAAAAGAAASAASRDALAAAARVHQRAAQADSVFAMRNHWCDSGVLWEECRPRRLFWGGVWWWRVECLRAGGGGVKVDNRLLCDARKFSSLALPRQLLAHPPPPATSRPRASQRIHQHSPSAPPSAPPAAPPSAIHRGLKNSDSIQLSPPRIADMAPTTKKWM